MRPAKYSPNVILESPHERDLVVTGLREYATITPPRIGAQLATIQAEHLAGVPRDDLAAGYYAGLEIIKRAAVGLEVSPSLNPEVMPSGSLSASGYVRLFRNVVRLRRAQQLDTMWRAAGAYEDATEELSKYEIQ